MTPFSVLIREARAAAVPTPSERAQRRAHGREDPDRGLTQAELAARAGLLQETIARAEGGKARPGRSRPSGVSEATLAAICDALGLDVTLVRAEETTPKATGRALSAGRRSR